MPRNHIGKVRFTENEWRRLQNKSRLTLGHINVSQYIRLKSLSSDISTEEMIVSLYKKLVLEQEDD